MMYIAKRRLTTVASREISAMIANGWMLSRKQPVCGSGRATILLNHGTYPGETMPGASSRTWAANMRGASRRSRSGWVLRSWRSGGKDGISLSQGDKILPLERVAAGLCVIEMNNANIRSRVRDRDHGRPGIGAISGELHGDSGGTRQDGIHRSMCVVPWRESGRRRVRAAAQGRSVHGEVGRQQPRPGVQLHGHPTPSSPPQSL